MFEKPLECPIAVTPPTDEGISDGAAWCDGQDGEDPLFLVTHLKSSIRGNPVLSKLAAQPWVEHVVLRGGLHYGKGSVLALVSDAADIAEVAQAGSPTALCVVSWATPEVVPWAQMVGALALDVEDPDGSRWDAPFPGLHDEVERELERVTAAINHNNVLSTYAEKRDTLSALERLHSKGLRPDPVVVMAWAAVHGWSGKNVKLLGEWVGRINGGGRLRHR